MPPARPVLVSGVPPWATSATVARQISSVPPSIPTTAGLSSYLCLYAYQPALAYVLVTCCGANAPRLSVFDPDGIKLMRKNYVSMFKLCGQQLAGKPKSCTHLALGMFLPAVRCRNRARSNGWPYPQWPPARPVLVSGVPPLGNIGDCRTANFECFWFQSCVYVCPLP